jgi:DNA-directed RNA polymerase subunit RPC12/RpoP
MGIFDLFRSQSKNDNQQREPKDERKAKCPNCHKSLSKIPGAKKKCPHCGEFMFVRTRPKDNVRVVVTKADADKIDEEWSIVAGTHDIFVAEKEKFAKEKGILRNRFGGKEPSDNDVRWGLLNKQLMEHAKNGDWGLYRNARFQMGEILRGEMKLKDALRAYLEVCYLDLNGPNNTGGMNDPELLKEFPPFDPNRDSFLAPGVIDLIKRIVLKSKLNKDEIKKIFIEHNSRIEKSLRLPLSVEKAWQSLEKEI